MEQTSQGNNLSYLGIGLMVGAMLTIPLVDGFAKHLSTSFSPLYISWVRYLVACFFIVPISLLKNGKFFLPRTHLGAHFLRTLFLVASMTAYFIAIASLPLATAISAFFVGPIVASVLSVVFLKEKMFVYKWVSVLLGFAGTLFIVRPGLSMDLDILLALASGVFFGVYMVLTRLASKTTDPIKTLTFQCLVGAIILFPQALLTWSFPEGGYYLLFIGIGCFSVLSHILSILAFRFAETSTLAPLVYVELLGSTLVGWMFFDDWPDLFIWIGASIIIAAGLILLTGHRRH